MTKKTSDNENVPRRGRPGDNISLAPLSVDEALEALLKTPPPPKEKDELAERLKRDSDDLLRESKKKITASKRLLKQKGR
jgi:hypothetical protein